METSTPSAASPLYRCALITGASSGLGEEFVRQLAPDCATIILVARRGDLLEKLSASLQATHPQLVIHYITSDLQVEEKRLNLANQLQAAGLVPDLLINNAGMGDYGSFQTADWAKLNAMLQLNVTALTHLCHLFLPGMLAQGRGGIINVSSLASTLPIPDFAVYAATKAYVSSFSEALRLELLDYRIPVLAVCPGPVHTGFGKVAMRAESAEALPSREGFYVTPQKVVRDSLRALGANQARVFPGWKVALLASAIALLPMPIVRYISLNRRGKI